MGVKSEDTMYFRIADMLGINLEVTEEKVTGTGVYKSNETGILFYPEVRFSCRASKAVTVGAKIAGDLYIVVTMVKGASLTGYVAFLDRCKSGLLPRDEVSWPEVQKVVDEGAFDYYVCHSGSVGYKPVARDQYLEAVNAGYLDGGARKKGAAGVGGGSSKKSSPK